MTWSLGFDPGWEATLTSLAAYYMLSRLYRIAAKQVAQASRLRRRRLSPAANKKVFGRNPVGNPILDAPGRHGAAHPWPAVIKRSMPKISKAATEICVVRT